MVTRTARLVKCMETNSKPNLFDNANQVTILSLLGKFKGACDANETWEGVEMWLWSYVMAKTQPFL